MTLPVKIEVGRELIPLTIIDDAHPAPAVLQEEAQCAEFRRDEGDYYPGLRASVSDTYPSWLEGLLAGIGNFSGARVIRSSFALAADDPARLAPIQRIPHFDDTDPSICAVVHYLCAPPHGGTSFYRHLRTGFERIDASRIPAWRQGLAEDAKEHGMPPAAYWSGNTARFERTGIAELRFNRLIVYPASCLHAGDIGLSWQMDSAVSGRLTLTSLIRLECAMSRRQ